MKLRNLAIAILLISGGVLFAMPTQAQWEVAPHVLISFPQADFANVSGTGGGLGVKVIHSLWGLSWLGLGGDFGYVSFGSGQRSADLGGFPVLVQSRNESFRLSVGPQLRVRIKRFQVYAASSGGVYNYRTVITVPTYTSYPFTETTDSLTKLGWSAGGGLMYDIGLGPWIDLGLHYATIRNAVSSEIDGEKIQSDANEINLTLGVVFFLD